MKCKYCGGYLKLTSTDSYKMSEELADYRIRENYECVNCGVNKTVDKNKLGNVISSFYYK